MSRHHIGVWVRLSVSGTMSTIAGMYFMRTAGQDIPPSGKENFYSLLIYKFKEKQVICISLKSDKFENISRSSYVENDL